MGWVTFIMLCIRQNWVTKHKATVMWVKQLSMWLDWVLNLAPVMLQLSSFLKSLSLPFIICQVEEWHAPLPVPVHRAVAHRTSLFYLVSLFPASSVNHAQLLSKVGPPHALISSNSLPTRISAEHEKFWGAVAIRKKNYGCSWNWLRQDFMQKNLPFSIPTC